MEKTEKNNNEEFKYFEHMHVISEMIRQTMDPDKLLRDLADAILKIFNCDRVWLLYPLDPKAKGFRVPVEAAKKEYPGMFQDGIETAMTPVLKNMIEQITSSIEPVVFDMIPSDDLHTKYSVKSQMVVAIRPKIDRFWGLGMHQCSDFRVWTKTEQRLFMDIASRVSDALSNMLLYKDLLISGEALKKANEELARQYEELKKVDKMKDSLVSDVAHELKTPVAKYRMSMELLKQFLKDKGLYEECSSIIKILDSSIERQERTISNILDLFHLEKGQHEYIFRPFRIDELLNDVINDYKPMLEAKHIILETKIAPQIIISDSQMLYHVFSNIINNAIKFRNQKVIPKINILFEKQSENIVIKITDNGLGLTGIQKEKAFDRFYQASTSIPGSGVGLSIAKMIIADLNGKISIESPGKDQGTSVIIELPVERHF